MTVQLELRLSQVAQRLDVDVHDRLVHDVLSRVSDTARPAPTRRPRVLVLTACALAASLAMVLMLPASQTTPSA